MRRLILTLCLVASLAGCTGWQVQQALPGITDHDAATIAGAWTAYVEHLENVERREALLWAVHVDPFLVCTRSHESSPTPPLYDDGYGAVSASGTYRGAYQFARSTWDATARHAGAGYLVGVDPAAASVVDQDLMAFHLSRWQGAGPWLYRCSEHL